MSLDYASLTSVKFNLIHPSIESQCGNELKETLPELLVCCCCRMLALIVYCFRHRPLINNNNIVFANPSRAVLSLLCNNRQKTKRFNLIENSKQRNLLLSQVVVIKAY